MSYSKESNSIVIFYILDFNYSFSLVKDFIKILALSNSDCSGTIDYIS